MIALARFISRGRSQAAMVISVFALFGIILLFPPLLLISGAALALVTLSNVLNVTLFVLALAWLFSASILFVVGLIKAAYVILLLWLPIFISAEVLRRSRNMALALLAVLLVTALGVLIFMISEPDPAAMWRHHFESLFSSMPELAEQYNLTQEKVDLAAVMMTGFIAALVQILLVACLLLGRWWQSRLVNSDGFRREFTGLNLGRVLSLVSIALLIASLIFRTQLLIALTTVFVTIYLFQSLAVLHAFTAGKTKARIWLTVFYVLLILSPDLVIVVSLCGMGDAWLDSRRRWLVKNG